MLGDLRVIFLTAESAPSVARFRPHRNLVDPVNPVVGCKRVEILSEQDKVGGNFSVLAGFILENVCGIIKINSFTVRFDFLEGGEREVCVYEKI